MKKETIKAFSVAGLVFLVFVFGVVFNVRHSHSSEKNPKKPNSVAKKTGEIFGKEDIIIAGINERALNVMQSDLMDIKKVFAKKMRIILGANRLLEAIGKLRSELQVCQEVSFSRDRCAVVTQEIKDFAQGDFSIFIEECNDLYKHRA